jgi:putative membrane protein
VNESDAAGADPDSRARTHLANERTFLAWLRTGLNLIALGLVAAQLLEQDLFPDVPVVTLFAALLVASGVAMAGAAGVHFARSRDQIEAGVFRSSSRVIVVAVGLVALVGLIALGLVFLLREGG